MGKGITCNTSQKKAGVAIIRQSRFLIRLLLDKVHFYIKNMLRDKEGHFIIIKSQFIKKI